MITFEGNLPSKRKVILFSTVIKRHMVILSPRNVPSVLPALTLLDHNLGELVSSEKCEFQVRH